MSSEEVTISRWKKAFPLAGFAPVLKKPSDEEVRIAEQFKPILFADPAIIEEEKTDLSHNLGLTEKSSSRLGGLLKKVRGSNFAAAADALFLFRAGKFPRDLTGAKMGVLGVDLPESELPWDKEMHGVLEQIRERLRKDYAAEYQAFVKELYYRMFPSPETSTCVVKYRVLRDRANSDICCIQYFAYWPIQLLPRHWYDYEPVYVYVRKEGKEYIPLFVVFNAEYGVQPLFSGKRPGHTIRTFINWDSKDLQITPEDFNPMAQYMTQAFGGSYHYRPISSEKRSSHISTLYSRENKIALSVTTKWHSYEVCDSKLLHEKEPLICELQPLKTQDLLHIEWEIRQPFQAPFLYPTVGKKNALMHFPLNVSTLWQGETYRRWSDYALVEFHIKHMRPSQTVSNMYAYQVGLFIDIFAEISGESMGLSMWPLIEARERELEGTLSLIRRLKGPKR